MILYLIFMSYDGTDLEKNHKPSLQREIRQNTWLW